MSSVISDSLTSYDWKIDTKYYTANVCICLTSNPLNGTELMMESVEAFIIYFDSHKVWKKYYILTCFHSYEFSIFLAKSFT